MADEAGNRAEQAKTAREMSEIIDLSLRSAESNHACVGVLVANMQQGERRRASWFCLRAVSGHARFRMEWSDCYGRIRYRSGGLIKMKDVETARGELRLLGLGVFRKC